MALIAAPPAAASRQAIATDTTQQFRNKATAIFVQKIEDHRQDVVITANLPQERGLVLARQGCERGRRRGEAGVRVLVSRLHGKCLQAQQTQ